MVLLLLVGVSHRGLRTNCYTVLYRPPNVGYAGDIRVFYNSLRCACIPLVSRFSNPPMALTLITLPFELILQISTYLQPSSHLALHLTSRILHQILPYPDCEESLSRSTCEYIAFSRVWEDHQLWKGGQRRCIICSAIQSLDFFRGQSPICKWHDGWLMSSVIPEFFDPFPMNKTERQPDAVPPYWVAIPRKYCMHCREVLGWHLRDCACRCDSCGDLEVDCYVRVSSSGNRPISWRLEDIPGRPSHVVEQHSLKRRQLDSVVRRPEDLGDHDRTNFALITLPVIPYCQLLEPASPR